MNDLSFFLMFVAFCATGYGVFVHYACDGFAAKSSKAAGLPVVLYAVAANSLFTFALKSGFAGAIADILYSAVAMALIFFSVKSYRRSFKVLKHERK